MGHYVDILLEFVTRFAEVGAAIVILTGITQTLYRWARHWRWGRISPDDRISLGRSIVLGLDFLVASDVLMTAIAPTWSHLGQVASVILLRLLLAYFLELELRRFMESREGSA
ncbi:MAG TPA: DUF1622 domain-containing protein [Armatimonadota bacterium]|jgi:uncharacterized membrane protein|nr:DUF1622 domain-containing protein [Armatimonadota bacterium]HOJ21980.1 DUF1622 domain-containing protein [Armatimonadota bacterium]HOM80298.1 DUF1622 domain-containing protein [Armatimonadota bacterium]HOQ27345.1 DUF1622 domain-containing protein [Armatimonadota bacterium]HPO71298.1 DUF1622 domain-containing protein [Armatimonadota bacterium]